MYGSVVEFPPVQFTPKGWEQRCGRDVDGRDELLEGRCWCLVLDRGDSSRLMHGLASRCGMQGDFPSIECGRAFTMHGT